MQFGLAECRQIRQLLEQHPGRSRCARFDTPEGGSRCRRGSAAVPTSVAIRTRQQDGPDCVGIVGQLPATACGSVRRGSQLEDEVAWVRSRTARGDDDVDAKRSRPSIGKPAMCHARKERAELIGTDQRITSGPAATTAASRGRIHGCTRIVSRKVRFFSLAPRAPSIHGTKCGCGHVRYSAAFELLAERSSARGERCG